MFWKLCRSVCASGCLFFASGVSAQSMTEAVQLALSQYPAIRAAEARAQAAEAEVGVAQSQHWPQVAWQGTQSTYSNTLASPIDPNNTWIQSPTVSVNIWSGWRIEAEVERAKALSQSGSLQQKITRDEVALIALEAYLNWAKSLELVELARQNLNEHERIRKDIVTIVSVDSGRMVDLQQADVRRENAQLSLSQREAELEIARQRLARIVVARPPAKPSGVNAKFGAVPNNVDVALAAIDDTHPVIAQQLAQVDAGKAAVRGARAQFSPSVDLSYGKQATQGTGQGDYLTQLTVSMPIFSGGSSVGAMRSANAQLEASEYALQEARIIQRERLLSAWAEWKTAEQRSRLGISQSKTSSALVKGYEEQFRVGRRSLLDLLNVQNDLYNYQSSAITAAFDVKVARARILAAMGRLAAAFSSPTR